MSASAIKPVSDRIDLKLYNTIVIYDVYAVAREPQTAREAIMTAIASGDAKPTESTATEVRRSESIRASWLDQAPYVAADVTDAEFDKLRGITASIAFERFYTKRG